MAAPTLDHFEAAGGLAVVIAEIAFEHGLRTIRLCVPAWAR